MTARTRQFKRFLPALTGAALALASLSLAGCTLGALIGGMAANAERSGSKTVKAKYTGLTDKSFAVVIAADRSILGEVPDLVSILTREISRRIADNAGASGMVPADDVLRFQFQRPAWVAMSPTQLAKELEVDRLIFIDLQDFALTDPGNPYIWAGSASGVLNVLEVEKTVNGEFGYREPISVAFPDNEGLGPDQIPRQTVTLELMRRFVNRASWIFYEHEEPNAIKY